MVLGLALALLYEWTDNLLAPIAAHAMFNAVNVVGLFYQSHTTPAAPGVLQFFGS